MPSATARFFDAMAASYDQLEPWYAHLYSVLHGVLEAELAGPRPGPRRALDAGCGTGFQTALLVKLGYRAHGIDVSTGALRVARERHGAGVAVAAADLGALPYGDASFDAVVCCGSTLNFIENPARALAEIGRVLQPGGRLLLECEHRWSFDLMWAMASAVLADALRYGLTARAAWRQIGHPVGQGIWIEYPGYPALRLATRAELRRWLAGGGLVPVRTWGIHALTNLIPSTVLHRPRLGRTLAAIYRGLAAADRAVARVAAVQSFANSLLVLARKR